MPVILDKYFIAPHLASGDSKQIAEALWNEIQEIREPVKKVREWLEHECTENLENMIYPVTTGDLQDLKIDENDFKEELSTMTLEDFFETLQ